MMKDIEEELRRLEILRVVIEHNIQAMQLCIDSILKKMAEEEGPDQSSTGNLHKNRLSNLTNGDN